MPFRSGHVLALRSFPASSLGPGYTSISHRDRGGSWTFYSTIAPEQSCSRYFGSQIEQNIHANVQIEWTDPDDFRVTADGSRPMSWEITLTQTVASRVMNAAAGRVPDGWWRKPFTLRMMGFGARLALRAEEINLAGRTPNGQQFLANPQEIWLVKSSRAAVDGVDLGPVGPLSTPARLNDFVIPQRGIFAVARAFLEKTDQVVLSAARSQARDARRAFGPCKRG